MRKRERTRNVRGSGRRRGSAIARTLHRSIHADSPKHHAFFYEASKNRSSPSYLARAYKYHNLFRTSSIFLLFSDCYAAGNLFYDIPDVDSTLDGDEIAGLTRQRRTRVMFTRFQLKQLERLYAVDQYPKLETRRRVGDQMGITERRIQVKIESMSKEEGREHAHVFPALNLFLFPPSLSFA